MKILNEESVKRIEPIREKKFVTKFPQMITHVKVGDIIKEEEKKEMEPGTYQRRAVVYKVRKVYPFHVLTVDIKTGNKRCFNIGDLIMRGLEVQEPVLEALRRP